MKKHDPSEVLTSLLLQSPDEDGSVEGHTSAELREKTGLSTPTLIVQGDRDRFGTPGEVASYLLSEEIRVHWMPDGDHDLVPRKKSGRTAEENWAEAVDVILGFIDRQR